MDPLKHTISIQTVIFRSATLIGSKSVQDALLSILFIILARVDQSGYGLIILGLSIVMLLRSLQSMGLDQYTLRELSSCQKNTGPLLRQMLLMKGLLGGGIFFIFLIFAFFIKQWPVHQVTIISILLFSQCIEGMAETFFTLFRAEGQSVNESLCRTGPNIISFFYGVGCLYFQLNIFFFSLLFLLNSSLKFGAAIFGAKKLSRFSLNRNSHFKFKRNELITLGIISAVSFFGTFYNEIQIFWIRQYYTFIDVAIYKVASDVTGSICGIVAHLIIGAVLFPQLVHTFSNKDMEQFQEMILSYFKKIIAFGSGLAVFLAVFGGKIAIFIYGDKYLASEYLIPFFGVAAFFSFANNFIIYVLLAMRQEKRLLFVLAVPVCCSIIMGPLLIAETGATGGVISLLLSRALLLLVFLVTFQKKIVFFRIADYKNIVFCWIGSIALFFLLARFNFFLAAALALSLYICLICYEEINANKIKA